MTKVLTIYLLLLVVCLNFACKRKAAEPEAPAVKRIILITIDTLRADALSVYGSKIATPFFDGFAKRSVVFDNAFTCVPITLPAHTSLLSGLYPPSHGVRNNGTFRAPAQLDLLSEYAKQNQFATAAVIGGFPLSAQFGLDQGFDLYEDHFQKRQSAPGVYLFAEKDAEQVRKLAEEWLSKHTSDPFLLWMHFFDPHDPYVNRGMTGIPPYKQEVLYVDRQLAFFFEYLKKNKLDEQALIIVTSDHGEAFGEHGEISHSVFIYNTTLRIPLLISAPGINPSNKKELARIIDIAPTILDILQWKPKAKMDGVSLLPLLLGKQEPPRENYAETLAPALDFGWSPLLSVQDLNAKFILAPHSEFYNLMQDPGETQNLITATDAGPYRKRILEISTRQPVSKNTAHAPTQEERDQLESLGYLSGGNSKMRMDAPDPKDRIQVARAIAELTRSPINLPEKEQAYRTILKQEASNPLLLLRYGEILLKLRKNSEAEKIFQRVLDLEYPHADVYNGLAAAYFYQNQPGKAEIILNQAVQLKLADGETYYNLAEINFGKGNTAGAMLDYDRSMQLGFLQAFLRKARLLEIKGDSAEAFQLLEKAESLAPQDARINAERGVLLAKKNQLQQAAGEFQKALQKNPQAKHLLYNIGLCYYRLGEKEKAREYLKEFLASAPTNLKDERSAAAQMLHQ